MDRIITVEDAGMKKEKQALSRGDRITRRRMLGIAGTLLGAGITGLGGYGALSRALHAGENPSSPEARVRPRGKKAKPGSPNILFILGDNHNADTMGCAGHPFIETPGMDRLVREGVRFEQAFNTTSLCSPSRASILTGAYAHRHGVKNNHTPWTGTHTTFLEHLSRAGYATAFIGKWHMPGKLPDLPFLDLFVTYTYREGQGAYFNCPMIVNGHEVPSRKPYITEEVTDYATEFIDRAGSRDDGRPWCVYISHRPGHPPFQSPRGIAGMYDHRDVSAVLPSSVDPLWFGKTKGNVFQGVMMGSYHGQYRRYCETLTAMDRDIERILEHLDRRGLAENTVVIYMGDNGMQWGTHGRHGIREPYEESIRLPFIVRAPGIIRDAGARSRQMVLNIDIAPTLLDLAGVPAAGDMDGMSIVPLLKDPGRKSRDAFLLEFWRYFPENTPGYRGIRTDRYKYVEFERGRGPWLFDLGEDPKEKRNLYGGKGTEALASRLKKRLTAFPGR